jgi:hypothetical protein
MPPIGIRNSQRRCTKAKHKEAWALREREELITIVIGTSRESAFEPMSGKQERMRIKGF